MLSHHIIYISTNNKCECKTLYISNKDLKILFYFNFILILIGDIGMAKFMSVLKNVELKKCEFSTYEYLDFGEAHVLGDNILGNRLFVRDVYSDFLDIFNEGYQNRFRETLIITGTPGVGKSLFAAYLLWHIRRQGSSSNNLGIQK